MLLIYTPFMIYNNLSYEYMAKGMKAVFALVGIAITTYIATVLFNFLGVGYDTYGSYLAWMVALGVFYIVLPTKVGTVFSPTL